MQSLPAGIDIITIYGPTASGKTAIAVQLAEMLGAVLFSADSRQVYRGMDIGTGKDLDEYVVGEHQTPYRMIDIAEAGERYNLYRYMVDFHQAYHELPPEKPKILCGGTGLYMTAVLGGFELYNTPNIPELRTHLEQLSIAELQGELERLGGNLSEVEQQNRRRLIRAIEVASAGGVPIKQWSPLVGPIFCIDISREVRRERITKRLLQRLQQGMIEEVEGLLQWVDSDILIGYGLEYRYITYYLQGKLSYDEMYKGLETAIHQFSKRQMTWVRGMERNGWKVNYIAPNASPRETAEEMMKWIFDNY